MRAPTSRRVGARGWRALRRVVPEGLRLAWRQQHGRPLTEIVTQGARFVHRWILRRARRTLGVWRYRHVTGPIVVYQMGKVGSLAVYEQLRNLGLRTYHVHQLVRLDEHERSLRATRTNPERGLAKLADDRHVLRLIQRHPDHVWNVVSLVREPVARLVSTFFEVLDEFYPEVQAQYRIGACRIQVLHGYFLERFPTDGGAEAWFDEQMKPMFDMDVFAVPFPKERGYLTIRQDRFTLLLIRLEDLDACAAAAFQEAFGIAGMRVPRFHSAEEKWYRDLYREFVDTLVLPEDYLTRMYGSRFARHFYTSDEIAKFRDRWTHRRRYGQPPLAEGAGVGESTAMPVALDELNRMNRTEFTATLGAIFEASPWVAEQAFAGRPFASVEALHGAMTGVVREAPREAQLTLLRAHPDLAGKVARAGTMSAASVAEQASAGLDRLTDEEGQRFDRLNAAYRERFGFPFIIAVRHHTRAGILDACARRLAHTVDREVDAALAQVFEITRLRLRERVRA